MSDFSGEWFTTFGKMTLTQTGPKVQGFYQMGPSQCGLEGTIRDGMLQFRYQEPAAAGRAGSFCSVLASSQGNGVRDRTDRWSPWQGQRGFNSNTIVCGRPLHWTPRCS